MVGHQWVPWFNNPTQAAASETPAKQEQETPSRRLRLRKVMTCHRLGATVALSTLCLLLLVMCASLVILYTKESDRKPGWKSLVDIQNMSDSFLTLTKANRDLRKDNEILKERSVQMEEETRLLNRTSAQLKSMNLALSLESSDLTEQIMNLTSTNARLSQDQEGLVRQVSEQDEKRRDMSGTIERLLSSNTHLQEEKHQLSEVNGLLRDELLQAKQRNHELEETNEKAHGEIEHLSEKIGAFWKDKCEKLQAEVTRLQEQNQDLSTVLVKQRQEAAEQEGNRTKEVEQMVAEVESVNRAYRSLDLYCPVVNPKTKERVCRKCLDSWKQFDTKCYYFSSRMLSWSSSRSWCRTQGGDLLIVSTEQEQRFVSDSSRAVDESSPRLWVGMTDAEEEGEWRWVDGSKVTSDVEYWLSRPGTATEPDDWKLDDPLGEDCGHIDASEAPLKSWMDGSCKIPYRWICEKNL